MPLYLGDILDGSIAKGDPGASGFSEYSGIGTSGSSGYTPGAGTGAGDRVLMLSGGVRQGGTAI